MSLPKCVEDENTLPLAVTEWRDVVLKAADISTLELAESVGKAFKEVNRLIHANDTRTLVVGDSVETIEVPDNQARLRAIDLAIKFAGAMPTVKPKAAGNGGNQIHVHFPDIYGPRDITPKEVIINTDANI